MTRWVLLFVVLLQLVGACSAAHAQEDARLQRAVRHPYTGELEETVRRTLEKALAEWSQATQQAASAAEEGAAYAELGKVYLAHHFYMPAADALAIARQLTAAPPEWHYLEAVALRNSYQPETALQSFQEARKSGPIGNAAYYVAELLIVLGDMQRARIALEPLPDEPATEAAVYALAGRVAQAQTRFADAEKYYREALRLQPLATALMVPLAQVVHRQSRRTEARVLLRQAGEGVITTPDSVLAEISVLARGVPFYMERGQQLMRQRKFQAAASEFSIAVDLNPGNAQARLSNGRALEIIGNFELARLNYEQAINIQPDYPVAQYFFGSFLERQGEVQEAQEHYANAVAQDPDYMPPRLLLAHMYFRAGNFVSAREHYLAISTRHDRHVQARLYAALASLMESDCTTAIQTLNEASKVKPRDASVKEVLARAYALCSKSDDELNLAREIGEDINANRPDAAAAQTLAMVHAARQDFERAIEYQLRAIKRAGDQAQGFMHDALQRYQSGQQANFDWVRLDTTFVPPRLTANKSR